MPNIVAYLALLSWPAVSVLLFRKLSIERAIIWTILAGYLLLPPVATFNLPLLPSLDKMTIPSICAFAICFYLMTDRRTLLPSSKSANALMILFVAGAIPTVLANPEPFVFTVLPNSDPIVYKIWELPGLKFRDIFSVVGNQAIALFPFLLARRFLATESGLRELLFALVVAGLIYSIPALLEIRISPQLNIWIYGFFQHDFSQTYRGGGFRPFVFLPHGLWLAFFVVTTLLAATALARGRDSGLQTRYVLAMIYLAGLLYLCKSLGSLLYGIALSPVVLFTGPRWQIRLAAAFALIAVIYPLLRGNGLVPTDDLLAFANSIDTERAASLAYRFNNEDLLLAQASEKPWLGWGGWGRNLIHDPDNGDILTIPDGRWIITFGTYGWLGYIAEFGLIALPILLLGWTSFTAAGARISRNAAVVVLILAVNMIDMLLNATLTPLTWVTAGAALGYFERMRQRDNSMHTRPKLSAAPVMSQDVSRTGRRTAI